MKNQKLNFKMGFICYSRKTVGYCFLFLPSIAKAYFYMKKIHLYGRRFHKK